MRSHWIFLTLGLAACSGPAEIPNTPDLRALANQYDQPSAVIDQQAAEDALMQIPPLESLAAGFRASSYATRGINEAEDSSNEDPESVRIQGSIRVTIRCPGELDDPVYDASTNGTLALTLGVQENRVRRGIGGKASACILHGDDNGLPVRVMLDGPFALDLGRDISIKDRWSGRLLMLITGTIHIGDLELSGLSARFTDDTLEYLFVLPDKKWVIAQLTAEGISVKDRDHVWVCPSGQPCAL